MPSSRYQIVSQSKIALIILTMLVFFLFVTCPQEQNTWELKYHDFRYIHIPYTQGIVITGYTGKSTDIIIPSHIEDIPVIYISGVIYISNDSGTTIHTKPAFINKNLTSVVIPETITRIGGNAFAYNNLTEINFPENLVAIEGGAFWNNKLTSVIIPDSIFDQGLQGSAFENNEITDVVLGSGVRRIGSAAFKNNKINILNVPENVILIGSWAFADNEITELSLAEGMSISEGIAVIDSCAFENNKLESLSIPDNFIIGDGAFLGNNITQIRIGENVELRNIYYPVFELGFDDFYIENGEQSGYYIYENGEWKFR